MIGKHFEATQYEIITLKEFIWLFKTFCKSIGKLLQNKMPEGQILKLFAMKAFEIADTDDSKMLSRDELLEWYSSNLELKQFFNKYETEDAIAPDD